MSQSPPVRRLALPATWAGSGVALVLAALGGRGRLVGGAVRDHLLGRTIGDIDIATPLAPDLVGRYLSAAGIRVLATGLEHGTISALTETGTIEVTTLRRDLITDGRHATVAFTEEWAEDARRRDLTINALYLDGEGWLYDPTGQGLADLEAGQVRFIGDPLKRIMEDRLRILRFYRFHAHYARGVADAAARAACRAQAETLRLLSPERIKREVLKLLAAPDPTPTVSLMAEDGVLGRLLSGPMLFGRLAGLVKLERTAQPLRRLGALLTADAAPRAATALRLSIGERDRLVAMCATEPVFDLDATPAAMRAVLYRCGRQTWTDRGLLAAAAQPDRPDLVQTLIRLETILGDWAGPRLPVSGADALALGVTAGPPVGALLRAMEDWWIAMDFAPDRAACLDHMGALVRASATEAGRLV